MAGCSGNSLAIQHLQVKFVASVNNLLVDLAVSLQHVFALSALAHSGAAERAIQHIAPDPVARPLSRHPPAHPELRFDITV